MPPPPRVEKSCGPTAALLLLALLACAAPPHARAQQLPVKTYTTADGLGHDRVNRIVRDSRGFLWFCTSEGLSRFDGYEFRNYARADGLPHSGVNDLLELGDGTYLVATGDGVAALDPKGAGVAGPGGTPLFRAYRTRSTLSGRRPVSVADLHLARDGKVWAGAWDGLHLLSRDGGEWRLEPVEAEAWRGRSPEFYRIVEDRFGRLWLGAYNGGLFVFDPASGRSFEAQTHGVGLSVLDDGQGRVWSGGGLTEAPGVYLFDAGDAESRPALLRRFTKADGLTEDTWINALLKTSDGRVLVGTAIGLCEFLPDAKPGEPSFRTLLKIDIVSLAEDSAGNIWIGTAANGAAKLTRRGVALFQLKESPQVVGFSSIFPGGGRELFLTWSQYDLFRFDGEKASEIRLGGMPGRSWGNTQLDLRSRVDGEWWVPTGHGLARYPAVGRFEDLARTPPKRIYTERDGLAADEVFRLYEDSRGDLWLSALGRPHTLTRWERRTETFRRFNSDDGLPPSNGPTAFAEDAAGNLWLGFYSGGVARLRGGRFEYFQKTFPTGLVNAIHRDARGRLWVAVSNSGVVRVDDAAAEEPRFVTLGVADGLSSDRGNCVTEDAAGRIYVGTGRGISRIDTETGRIKNYTQADGLPHSSVTACARDGEGNLWFTQRFTLVRLAPDAAPAAAPPPVFIASLRAGGETVRKLSELGESEIGNVELASDRRQLQIDFFGLSFSTAERLLYQYKLDGAGADWGAPTAERTANLTLAPGSYRFLVRAVNSDGVASERPAVVSFRIARPVWQRPWFVALLLAAFAAAAYAFHRYRVAQLLKVERVRTRIATDLHDDIGASLSQIAIMSEVVSRRVGDGDGVAEPLAQIAGASREMVDSMSDIVWAINPRRDHLDDLAQRMRRFASDLLEARDISLRFRAPESDGASPLGADLRREVYLIFKETINNAAKHSGCAAVEVDFDAAAGRLAVTVRDDGRGFDPAAPGGNGTGMGGHGLHSMRRRAESLGGSYEIESAPGRGTTVTLRVPLGGAGARRLREFFSRPRRPTT